MVTYSDFTVEYTESSDEMTKSILKAIILDHLKSNKPRVILVVGRSGTGKSVGTLRMFEHFGEMLGIDYAEYVKDTVIITPKDYHEKVSALMDKSNKRLKPINFLMSDEARELANSKEWNSKTNRAISDINAVMRGVKPIAHFILSQNIRDIDSSIRRTADLVFYYRRNLNQPAMVIPYKIYEDMRDIDQPKIRKARLKGWLVNGKKRQRVLLNFKLTLPRKETVQAYRAIEFDSKIKIIQKRLEDMAEAWAKETEPFDNARKAAQHYAKNPDLLGQVIQIKNNKIVLNDNFRDIHKMTGSEAREFHREISRLLKEAEIIK